MSTKSKKRKPTPSEIASRKNLSNIIKCLDRYGKSKHIFYFFVFSLVEDTDVWIDQSLADFEFTLLSRIESDPLKWVDGLTANGVFEEFTYGCDDDDENPAGEGEQDYGYPKYLNVDRRLSKARTYLEKFRKGRLTVWRNESRIKVRDRRSPIVSLIIQEQHFWELRRRSVFKHRDNDSESERQWSFWGESPKIKQNQERQQQKEKTKTKRTP